VELDAVGRKTRQRGEGVSMTRKMNWILFCIIGGSPFAVATVGAVLAAMDGNWIGFQVIQSVLWAVVVGALGLQLVWPGDTPTDGKTSQKEHHD
jgi:quinol-cytochrome oxidoreductase complex cytochrome b subunit